jgi:hypothetical protein
MKGSRGLRMRFAGLRSFSYAAGHGDRQERYGQLVACLVALVPTKTED